MRCLPYCLTILLLTFYSVSSEAADRLQTPADIAAGYPTTWLKSMPFGFKRHGFAVVSEDAGVMPRTGRQFARFEVRPGDCGNSGDWNDCTNDRERHELSQIRDFQSQGDKYWHGWSIYIPSTTPSIFPTKVHIGQFHQRNNNVLFLFSWDSQGLIVDNQSPGNGRTKERRVVLDKAQLHDRWIDVLVHAHWSSNNDGFFRAYIDRKLAYEYEGQTLAEGDRSFHKFGIYRSFVSRYRNLNGEEPPTQVLYYDNVHRGTELAKVDRPGIMLLQRKLAEAGLYTSTIDGLWGPNTKAATNKMLASLNLPAVDSYSAELWEFLD